jgi:hypothetical protein
VRLLLSSEAVGSLTGLGFLGGALLLNILGSLVASLNLDERLRSKDAVALLLALLGFLVLLVPVESLDELLELIVSLGSIQSLGLALGAKGTSDAPEAGIGASDLEVGSGETTRGGLATAHRLGLIAGTASSLSGKGAGDHGQR